MFDRGNRKRTMAKGPALVLAAAMLAASFLCSCAATYEAVFEITTTAVETVVKNEDAALHPAGDRIEVPPFAEKAWVSVNGSGRIDAAPGAAVELAVAEIEPPPGVRSRVTIGGREAAAADGRLDVRVGWSFTDTRLLPPKVQRIEIEIERGQAEEIDVVVMYTPMPGSKLEQVKTETRLTGPDSEKLKWTPSAEIAEGRVRGRVEAPAKD